MIIHNIELFKTIKIKIDILCSECCFIKLLGNSTSPCVLTANYVVYYYNIIRLFMGCTVFIKYFKRKRILLLVDTRHYRLDCRVDNSYQSARGQYYDFVYVNLIKIKMDKFVIRKSNTKVSLFNSIVIHRVHFIIFNF